MRAGERRVVRHALVDTGAELSWIPTGHPRVAGDRALHHGSISIGQWDHPRAVDRNSMDPCCRKAYRG
jgi:hypothetical protein